MVLVADNRLHTMGAAGATAVELRDAGATPTQFVVVERNVIEVDAPSAAAVAGEGDAMVVRDNVIVGAARTGVQVGVGGSEAPMPWLVIGNDFSGFTARDVDVMVSNEAQGAVVVCSGATTVGDMGQGSVVACD